MPRPSTTCASTRGITQTLMKRRETTSAEVSTPSCVSVSTLSGLIASMNGQPSHITGGLYYSSPGREEEEGTTVRTLRSTPEVQDCFQQSEQMIPAAGRQMGDQATSAAASTQPLSSSRSKEPSTSAAAVPLGKWEQVLHLWQCGPLCQELPNESAEADARTKSRQRKKAEGASQTREAQFHYSGGVT
jgi:hypothetical protein